MDDRLNTERTLVAPRHFGEVVRDLKGELSESSLLGVVDLKKSVDGFLLRNSRALTFDEKSVLAQIRNYAEVVNQFEMARTLRDKGKLSEAIDTSVDFQQRLAEMILKNASVGPAGFSFENNVDEVFEVLFDLAKRMGDKGLINRQEGGYIDGCRGMIAACLAFMVCGWKIRMPKPKWDKYYDIDLIAISPQGKEYGVDVTSSQKDMDMDEFTPAYLSAKRLMPKGRLLRGNIVLRVPQLTDERFPNYFEKRPRQKILGIPSDETIKKVRQALNNL